MAGNTPLIRIRSLSQALGVDILGKAEFLNPGGSVKDRVAMKMIDDAEFANLLKPGTNSRIFEGTVGSTGISIATLAAARYDPITI
ncbi:Cysteine synthase 2 [Serendipita sp. 411]|nr:Cysteine synthase 2 [Serendipita sp. 397]KAG8858174.1 Cysteine synthase 2 [Serendipita sp. 411]